MASFKYKALTTPREIRLLEWRIGQGMEFKLVHTTLDTCPPYMALSYTWGEPVFPHKIEIDGQPFPITANLHDFLEQFACHFKEAEEGSSVSYWIDAICINQLDDPERGAQICYMKEIYQRATTVDAWLGNSSEKTDFALGKLKEWYDYLKPFLVHLEDGESGDSILDGLLSANDRFIRPQGSVAYKTWEAINELLERPWWTRSWIVQEATAKSHSAVYLNYGSARVPWVGIKLLSLVIGRLAQWKNLDIFAFICNRNWRVSIIDIARVMRYDRETPSGLRHF